ncbi:hypothetical protein EK21DRAFT_118183 [Setomelanomma holmii]|uniref:Uncharacterized protein n=1 Tax=Setomelanomma holmii TaxID=210430 RepID=A0A9P4GYV0_9PLEO|nr:hypothetical protein EK21DRAFT_118183 [Setomelanomma holmii]
MAIYTSKVLNDPQGRCAAYNDQDGQRIDSADTALLNCPSPTPTPSSLPAPSVAASATPNPTSISVTQPNSNSKLAAGPSVTSVATPHKNGFHGGAVAGIAIGMLFAGVLIAGLVFFFILRRQRKRQYASQAVSHLPPVTYNSGPEKGPVVVASVVPNSIDSLLPQPESDDTLTGEASKIRDNIKNHVRVYCHSAPLASGITEAALLNIASETGLSTSAFASALSNPSCRQETLRLVFAWVILSKVTGGRSADLLPSGVSQLEGAIASARDHSKQTALHSKWKTITALLLSHGTGKNAHDANRVQTFSSIIAELDSIVAPCVQGNLDDVQRRKNLDMILTRAANFAFLLFSQPGSFQFDFRSRQGAMRAFPALVQTVGDQGQVLGHPRMLFEG